MIVKTKPQLLELLQERQTGWHIKPADYEKCIYRAIVPYEIEVTGGSKRPVRFQIYVWKKEKVYRIIERVSDIDPSRVDIVQLVCEIADRYQQCVEKENSCKSEHQGGTSCK